MIRCRDEEAVTGASGDRRPTIETIVATARRRHDEAVGRPIRKFGRAVWLCAVSIFAPLFGWQRYQLPHAWRRHRHEPLPLWVDPSGLARGTKR
jgi:hypothetical protein